jgi:hypothetical protein
VRADYIPVVTDAAAWSEVLSRTDVFKSYIMLLPSQPVPGNREPEVADRELRSLIRLVERHGLETAFEVGGLRCVRGICGETAGEEYAEVELRHLRRWLDAGGRIEYLTADHALTMNMRGVGVPGPGLDPERPCRMTLAELTRELVDYFEVVSLEIPGVRVGVIESLGFWEVYGDDGRAFRQTDPLLPRWRFTEFFDALMAAMEERGLRLDHFHIDFGYEGVAADGRRRGTGLEYGRVMAVERYVRSRGVRCGVIVNAFHDREVAEPVPGIASREARERTLAFARGYLAAGGEADHLVIQTWQPYPDRTGPESDPDTVLGVARDVLRTMVSGQ